MIRKPLIALMALTLSSAFAEEWSWKIGKDPGNKPIKNTGKISSKLDFIAFKTSLEKEPHLAVRVRNGKHKQGPSTISIKLENANILVQRIDINKPIAVIKKQQDGEHLLDSFTSEGKTYDIFYKVTGGELDPNIIIRSK